MTVQQNIRTITAGAPGRPDHAGVSPTPLVRERAAALSAGELPAYLYDLPALRDHAARVRAALPDPVELYYAAKANPEREVLTALTPYVDGYEVSSGGELAHVRGAVPSGLLAFGGPGKTQAELATALELGVDRFHVESAQELHMLGELATRFAAGTRVAVLLRVNLAPDGGSPDGGALDGGALDGGSLTMGGRPSPFGLDPAQADELVRLFAEGGHPHLELRGVHAHLASGLDAAELLAVAEAVVAWTTGLAERHRIRFTEVNVGGGMTVDYTAPERRFDWTAYGAGLNRLADTHPGLTLRIEPGRALTAYCGWYVTEVLDVKRSHGEEFAIVRGGTHHLRTPATKGHDQPCTVLRCERPWPHPWSRPTARQDRITFTGQLCTPKDVLARHVPVTGLRAGDRVAFALAGAYAWNISHHDFLMHPRPGFHFLEGPGGGQVDGPGRAGSSG